MQKLPEPMLVPYTYYKAYCAAHNTDVGFQASYERSRRYYIHELTAALRGERSKMSAVNLELLNERYPEWETLLYAAKDWEDMWA